MNAPQTINADRYYIIQLDAEGAIDDAKYAYFDTDLVNDATKEAFDLFQNDPELRRARGGVAHAERRLPGAFFFTCAPWLLVSEQVREMFGQFGICPSIRWIPTGILDRKGSDLATYWLAYGAKRHDVWDYARSDFFWQEGKQPGTREAAGYMRKGVLDPECVPPHCDLFLARSVYWIVSQCLRVAIEDSSFEGFDFEEVYLAGSEKSCV